MLDRSSPLRAGAALALLTLALLPLATPAEAGWEERLNEALDAAGAAGRSLAADAERAIVAGGVVLYRHRHTVAGAVLGCAAGSLAGASSAVGAGLATGGASLHAAAPLA
ncbi:MAG TPA: hypothetical protein VFG47_15100, partial [Geminicoccaceae bacterium]|nr:hypothetical protein [Geminicoccaceae bacterium]